VNLIDEVPQTASAAEFDSKYEWMRWRCNWSWSYLQRNISMMIEAKLNDSSATRQLGYDLVHDLTQLNQSAFIVLRQQMQELQGGGASELIQSMRAAYPGIIQVRGGSTTNYAQGFKSVTPFATVRSLTLNLWRSLFFPSCWCSLCRAFSVLLRTLVCC